MKVQKVLLPETKQERWLVLDDASAPVEPIRAFLQHLDHVERSPKTIRAYAYHLRVFWEYLAVVGKDWTEVGVRDLSACIGWLRHPQPAGVVVIHEGEAARSEATINAILTCVAVFYDFHARLGTVKELPLYRTQSFPQRRYKSFLHGIGKNRPVRTKILNLKTPVEEVKILTAAEVEQLVGACQRYRDKFLVCLLYETGMRIGQALGLRHSDIKATERTVWVIPRSDNLNGARAKTREAYPIDVSEGLIDLYVEYLSREYGYTDSDYVFVNLWKPPIGTPLTESAVAGLFRRLAKATGIAVHPHLLRHSHATELIAAGWEPHLVQKRLGHASVQTTINTYVHLPRRVLKEAFQSYQAKRKEKPV